MAVALAGSSVSSILPLASVAGVRVAFTPLEQERLAQIEREIARIAFDVVDLACDGVTLDADVVGQARAMRDLVLEATDVLERLLVARTAIAFADTVQRALRSPACQESGRGGVDFLDELALRASHVQRNARALVSMVTGGAR